MGAESILLNALPAYLIWILGACVCWDLGTASIDRLLGRCMLADHSMRIWNSLGHYVRERDSIVTLESVHVHSCRNELCDMEESVCSPHDCPKTSCHDNQIRLDGKAAVYT